MKIIRAEYLGMCFGVRDAIAMARHEAAAGPLTVLGELVHNETVLDDLRARGVRFERNAGDVQTDTAMITAHGASERAIGAARAAGLRLTEATCPLVHFAHRSLLRLVEAGYHPVVIGRPGHVEVRGLTEDLTEVDVVPDEAGIMALQPRAAFGVVAQTTQPVDRVRRLVALLREFFPESRVQFIDTVCKPTKQRQTAAVALAQRSDVVIVVGGANSNNTRELAQTCGRFCDHVYHVQSAAEVCGEWLAGATTVGLTAGTSTPDELIDGVEARLRELAAEMAMAAA
ncbi:MAG: 4-hydroxy-3-methylbut-2-enyl diphosphate reductase [Verrucomicrobiales bacterium]|nr:4-hydroxy-3-methylbut-2-enyl diphosphate reductase [Verrucomicrobiales bacterium]